MAHVIHCILKSTLHLTNEQANHWLIMYKNVYYLRWHRYFDFEKALWKLTKVFHLRLQKLSLEHRGKPLLLKSVLTSQMVAKDINSKNCSQKSSASVILIHQKENRLTWHWGDTSRKYPSEISKTCALEFLNRHFFTF